VKRKEEYVLDLFDDLPYRNPIQRNQKLRNLKQRNQNLQKQKINQKKK
jgi:hypothetical protein